MPNPDKPHAYRQAIVTSYRLRHEEDPENSHSRDEKCPTGYCRTFVRELWLEGPEDRKISQPPCDVCGGSEQLLIHDVEAARFRKQYGLDLGFTLSDAVPSENAKRLSRQYRRRGYQWP